MEKICLGQLVRDICAGNYSQAQLVEFINLTQKISLGYLKYQEIIGKRIAGEKANADLELQDLAVDCIAELFSGDGSGNFPQLKRYYEPKFEEMGNITDADVMILTRRLVVRKTKQELSRIFRERDPEGAKIVRNIKVAIRTSEKLEIFSDLGKEYVFYKNGLEIKADENLNLETIAAYLRRKRPPIPEDVLHLRFIDIYSPSDSVSSSIRKLLKTVHEFEEYQNFLPIETIVKLIRRVKFNAVKERLSADELVPTPLDLLETKEIESYIDVVMNKVERKIGAQYLRSKKLDEKRADIYSRALRDVLNDLIQKKDNSSYFRNLRHYLPDLTQRDYRQNERSVFEYLAKVAKKEFRRQLKELL
ncbi:MAG: hypothetical protein EHM72_00150 [Calditrichaeota bacterium]|nr:MAG: hypothetical protein EHM72_00150 [Calditrichota bacterium]